MTTTKIDPLTKLNNAARAQGYEVRAITDADGSVLVVLADGRETKFSHLYLNMASEKLLREEVKRRFDNADEKH